MTLPAPLVLLLPVVVTAIAGYLTHSRIPTWLESLVAFVVLTGAAVLWSVFDQQLTGNLVTDIALIAAYCAALMASPVLQPLYQWLQVSTPSPLASIVKPQPIVMLPQDVATAPVTARSPLLPDSQGYTTRATQPVILPPEGH